MLPSDSFMSNLSSQLGYSTGVLQDLQLIVLVVFNAVDLPVALCMVAYCLEI